MLRILTGVTVGVYLDQKYNLQNLERTIQYYMQTLDQEQRPKHDQTLQEWLDRNSKEKK